MSRREKGLGGFDLGGEVGAVFGEGGEDGRVGVGIGEIWDEEAGAVRDELGDAADVWGDDRETCSGSF